MRRHTVTVYSKDGLSKRIAEVDETSAIKAFVLGHPYSPFELRMAVLVANEYEGWEGPPNPITARFYGCHLAVGFEEPGDH